MERAAAAANAAPQNGSHQFLELSFVSKNTVNKILKLDQ